jgi:glutamyl-tRNA synthetase
MELKQLILKHTLQNAVKFDTPQMGAVIGKLLSEQPELKQDMQNVKQLVQNTIAEVSILSKDERKAKLKDIAPEMLEKKEKKKRELPELKNAVQGQVITRIPPEPSKYAHIGHAISFLINTTYAEKYDGKCIVRFEDTNPETCKQEYVDAIMEDLEFLGIHPDEIINVSQHIGEFYIQAEKLITTKKAYCCVCPREKMQELRRAGKKCECHSTRDAMRDWEDMLSGKYEDGTIVLRLAGDMENNNHVMRDPVLFRVSRTSHYLHKDKYKVWPMYDLANAVMDGTNHVSHILRSNEFGTMRTELQNHLKDLLELPKQTVIEYGRFAITGATTKGREIRQMIEDEKVSGWDDPRLVTIRALRRRGFVKETFKEIMIKAGLSPAPTNLDWTMVEAINRKFLDASCDRYFFVHNPIEITIKKAPELQLELNLHPDKKGGRSFTTSSSFYIATTDYDTLKDNELYRLMDCLNFTKNDSSLVFDSKEIDKYKATGKSTMHWLPVSDNLVEVDILMTDGKTISGLAEETIKNLANGDIVQFARFGFCRLEDKDKMFFVFTHK